MSKLTVNATAHVKLVKIDDTTGAAVVEEHDVDLTDKEAQLLWLLQQQEETL